MRVGVSRWGTQRKAKGGVVLKRSNKRKGERVLLRAVGTQRKGWS